MIDDAQLARLRKERNFAGLAAVVFISLSMAVSLPRALQIRAELKRTNDELIGLQSDLVSTNKRVVGVEDKIRAVQAEIERLIKSAK